MIFISYDLQSEWKPLLDSRLPSLPLRTFIVFHYDFKRLMDIEDFHGLRGARLEPWSPPRSTPGWVGGLYRTIVYVCIYLGTAAHPVLTLQDYIDAHR